MCISHFSRFFSDLGHFQVVKWMFLIFHDFSVFACHIPRPTVDISKFSTFSVFPRHISRPKVCISHFPWFSVFFAIFQVLQYCISHFSRFFSDLRHFQVRQVDVSHFPWFSVFLPYSRPTVDISKFSTFFSFSYSHISVLKCVFLIFRDFQFSRHIPGPSVCISHFSVF